MNKLINPWANTQATNEVVCPRCGEYKKHGCVTPTGQLTHNIHGARIKSYIEKIGTDEFHRRHSKNSI